MAAKPKPESGASYKELPVKIRLKMKPMVQAQIEPRSREGGSRHIIRDRDGSESAWGGHSEASERDHLRDDSDSGQASSTSDEDP
jgi:hypothetical protein